jgi:hypothetical protein
LQMKMDGNVMSDKGAIVDEMVVTVEEERY